jgi:putative ABC transport system permease protein
MANDETTRDLGRGTDTRAGPERPKAGDPVLTTKPFVRAPLLLLRHPIVFSAVMGAAAILALVAASTPSYVSSATTTALERELEGRCPASYDLSVSSFLPASEQRQVLSNHLLPRFGDPVLVSEGTLGTAVLDGRSLPIKLMYRTGFKQDLDIIEGGEGRGLWMGQRLASDLGAEVGDIVTVRNGSQITDVPVAAVVADLNDRRTEPEWCAFESLLEPTAMGDLPTPLVFIDPDVLDFAHYDAGFATYGLAGINEQWTIPLDIEDMTVAEARAVIDALPALEASYHEAQASRQGATQGDGFASGDPSIHTDLDRVTDRVEALGDALGTSIDPLAIAVLATALGLMAVAGSYWVDARRSELRSLAARGVPPWALGLKAGLETVLPIATGTLVGWLIAGPVVALAGPGGAVDSAAGAAGLARAGGAAGLAVAMVMLVAARRSRSLLATAEPGHRSGIGIVVPLATAGTAYWVRTRLGDDAVVVGERALVGSIDPLVVLYPMLAFAAAALLGGILVVRVAPFASRISGGPAVHLASRRIASAPLLATVLVVGAAIPVATLVYSATLTRSTTSTIDAKGRSFVGADVAAPVYGVDSLPMALEGRATVVALIDRGDFAGQRIDVLAVDPDTFPDGAFWDPSFSEVPLAELMSRLGGMRSGSAPAVVANGTLGSGLVDARGMELAIDVVGTAEAFPGARRDRPLVVISQEALTEAIENGGRPSMMRYLLWVDDTDPSAIGDALRAEEIGFAYTLPATRTLDMLKFQAVVWTFDFLELYAALAGLIAIGAILLYADTRQRSRNLAYALARRMGLSRGDHIRASFLETAVPVITGVALGAGTALLTARTVYGALDPVPATPPGPRWVPAVELIVITAVGGLAVASATSRISQRAADTADTSELLRHGG